MKEEIGLGLLLSMKDAITVSEPVIDIGKSLGKPAAGPGVRHGQPGKHEGARRAKLSEGTFARRLGLHGSLLEKIKNKAPQVRSNTRKDSPNG